MFFSDQECRYSRCYDAVIDKPLQWGARIKRREPPSSAATRQRQGHQMLTRRSLSTVENLTEATREERTFDVALRFVA